MVDEEECIKELSSTQTKHSPLFLWNHLLWNRLDGLFDGYNFVTVLVVMSYSFTGLIVSVIMKYADNMVKIYAVAVSMALTMVLSIFLFDFEPSSQLFFGIITITISILMYFNIVTGEIPSKSSPSDNTPPRTLQKNKSSASLDDIKVEQQEAETKNN
jgi:hypothetical protein